MARETFGLMKTAGIVPDATVFHTILDCYAKSGKHFTQMMRVLKEMKKASIELDIRTWNILMDGYSRVEGKEDSEKALSVWKYLSGQQTHKSLGINLPKKASTVLPSAATLSIALDVCKIGRFRNEADKVWMYGQKSGLDILNPNVLTSYVEALASFDIMGADRVVELIILGVEGDKMPLRSVRPDMKTLRNAKNSLLSHGWEKHAEIIDAISKDGDQDTAKEMFDSMKRVVIEPDLVTFESMKFAQIDCNTFLGKHLSKMNESCVTPNIKLWNTIMKGYSRAVGEEDQKKALSIWKYLSGQQTHESLGIDLPEKASTVLPSAATLSIAFDICQKGLFEKEAVAIWEYGQENVDVVLNSTVLASYVEALAHFGEKGADLAVTLIRKGLEGKRMPLRSVMPDKKTLSCAKSSLMSNGWKEHAKKLDRIVARVDKPSPYKISNN
jgi:pentatricopeptide repeat protein